MAARPLRAALAAAALALLCVHAFALDKPFNKTPAASAAAAAAAAAGAVEPRVVRDAADLKRNARIHPLLIAAARRRAAALADGAPAVAEILPPGQKGLMPSFGSPKVPVFLVDFSDSPWNALPNNKLNTPALVQARMFGASDPSLRPYDGLTNFYSRSSYGKLSIQGTVFPYYRAKNPRRYYETHLDGTRKDGCEVLIEETLSYWASQGKDFTQFDNDGDGNIDMVYLKWTGPNTGWDGFWWAYQSSYAAQLDEHGGVYANQFVFNWISTESWCEYDSPLPCDEGHFPLAIPHTDIHETGHALGLPDLYDYDASVGPNNGVGGIDMMDAKHGDLNGYFKWLLGWLTPAAVGAGTSTVTLRPTGTAPDALIVFPGAKASQPFAEMFLVQYRKGGAGNDDANYYTKDGLTIWHVDGRLDDSAPGDKLFAYDNSYTDHLFMKLMEADGLEEIPAGNDFEENDLYVAGKVLTPTSKPSSKGYSVANSNVYVTGIGPAGAAITVTASIGPPVAAPSDDARALPNAQRASYHASLSDAAGNWMCSGALVRGDVVVTAGAGPCPMKPGDTATLGPAYPALAVAQESRKIKAMVAHPSASLQLVMLQTCSAKQAVALAASEAGYTSYKTRDWLLTGWKSLKPPGTSMAQALQYSNVRYTATCTAASPALGQACAALATGAGPCAGDEGSPLVYNTDATGTAPAAVSGVAALAKDVLAGVSIGTETCAKANSSAVFTSVGGKLRAWIANNMAAYPSPCWTKNATLGSAAVAPGSGPAQQAFAPPPGVVIAASDYVKVEAARAVTQCTELCRVKELYGAGCKAFSIYSGVNTGRRMLLGVLDPPAANYCVFYAAQVPELCGAVATGHCGKAVAAWRMTWTGA